MCSQTDLDESTERREDLNDRRVIDMATATTSSLPPSAIPASRSGTELHNPPRPSLFQGTRPSSDDKITDDLLHSPTLASRSQPHTVNSELPAPVEAAVWDWQAPTFGAHTQADNSDSTLTYFYEPQGELLLREHPRPVGARADEFTIPGPVVSSAADRRQPATNPLEALLSSTSVPGSSSSARVGTKRKSTTDLYETASKRPTLDMGEPDRTSDLVNVPSGKKTPVLERRNLSTTHHTAPTGSLVLPARKVFPIQIGDKLFRLSGASISSDGE
jgi:hypothetical protein